MTDGLNALVEELGPDLVRKLHRAYKLTAVAMAKRAMQRAEAEVRERQY
jgi:hypothetical protein